MLFSLFNKNRQFITPNEYCEGFWLFGSIDDSAFGHNDYPEKPAWNKGTILYLHTVNTIDFLSAPFSPPCMVCPWTTATKAKIVTAWVASSSVAQASQTPRNSKYQDLKWSPQSPHQLVCRGGWGRGGRGGQRTTWWTAHWQLFMSRVNTHATMMPVSFTRAPIEFRLAARSSGPVWEPVGVCKFVTD